MSGQTDEGKCQPPEERERERDGGRNTGERGRPPCTSDSLAVSLSPDCTLSFSIPRFLLRSVNVFTHSRRCFLSPGRVLNAAGTLPPRRPSFRSILQFPCLIFASQSPSRPRPRPPGRGVARSKVADGPPTHTPAPRHTSSRPGEVATVAGPSPPVLVLTPGSPSPGPSTFSSPQAGVCISGQPEPWTKPRGP